MRSRLSMVGDEHRSIRDRTMNESAAEAADGITCGADNILRTVVTPQRRNSWNPC